jgi:hypothetical protein
MYHICKMLSSNLLRTFKHPFQLQAPLDIIGQYRKPLKIRIHIGQFLDLIPA